MSFDFSVVLYGDGSSATCSLQKEKKTPAVIPYSRCLLSDGLDGSRGVTGVHKAQPIDRLSWYLHLDYGSHCPISMSYANTTLSGKRKRTIVHLLETY
jgi:hypothetical protein